MSQAYAGSTFYSWVQALPGLPFGFVFSFRALIFEFITPTYVKAPSNGPDLTSILRHYTLLVPHRSPGGGDLSRCFVRSQRFLFERSDHVEGVANFMRVPTFQ